MEKIAKRIIALMLAVFVAAAAVTVSPETKAEAASFSYNQNVSSSKVTKSSTSGSMPTAVTSVKGGKSYYFNLQTSDTYYITSAALYVKLPGDSSYTKVYTKTSSSGVHYVAKSYTINNTKGTIYYYWRIDYKTSSSSSKTTKNTSTKSITVSATTTISSTYNSALYSFISNSKWAVGSSWGSSQTPKASSAGGKGCYAYVADLVYKVYGASTPRSGTKFTSTNNIRAGDVLYLETSSGSGHWIYVYGRSGSTLYALEANYTNSSGNAVVYKSTNRFYIKTNSSGSYYIKAGSYTYYLSAGYHFEP